MKKKFPSIITNALTGWLGGTSMAIILGLAWPIIFPAIVRPEHYYGYGPALYQVILMAILVATPGALIGGIVGGRISMEGGKGAQRTVAFIFGIIFSIPFSCYMLWVFTGF